MIIKKRKEKKRKEKKRKEGDWGVISVWLYNICFIYLQLPIIHISIPGSPTGALKKKRRERKKEIAGAAMKQMLYTLKLTC